MNNCVKGNHFKKDIPYKGESIIRVMPCKGKSFSSLPASPVHVLHKVISLIKGSAL